MSLEYGLLSIISCMNTFGRKVGCVLGFCHVFRATRILETTLDAPLFFCFSDRFYLSSLLSSLIRVSQVGNLFFCASVHVSACVRGWAISKPTGFKIYSYSIKTWLNLSDILKQTWIFYSVRLLLTFDWLSLLLPINFWMLWKYSLFPKWNEYDASVLTSSTMSQWHDIFLAEK